MESAQQIIEWIAANHDDEKFNVFNILPKNYQDIPHILNGIGNENIFALHLNPNIQMSCKYNNNINFTDYKKIYKNSYDIIIPNGIDITDEQISPFNIQTYINNQTKKRDNYNQELEMCMSEILNINTKDISFIISDYAAEPICTFILYIADTVYYRKDIWEFPCKLNCPPIPLFAIGDPVRYLVKSNNADDPAYWYSDNVVLKGNCIDINDRWRNNLMCNHFYINDFIILMDMCRHKKFYKE